MPKFKSKCVKDMNLMEKWGRGNEAPFPLRKGSFCDKIY